MHGAINRSELQEHCVPTVLQRPTFYYTSNRKTERSILYINHDILTWLLQLVYNNLNTEQELKFTGNAANSMLTYFVTM